MAPASPHPVGTVFVQVVPSYADFFKDTPELAKEMDKKLGADMAKNHDAMDKAMGVNAKRTGDIAGKEIASAIDKKLGVAGKQSADRFMTTFEKQVTAGAKKAAASLGNLKLGGRNADLGRDVRALKNEFLELGKVKILSDKDYQDAAKRLRELKDRARAVFDEVSKKPNLYNAEQAREAMASINSVASELDRLETERKAAAAAAAKRHAQEMADLEREQRQVLANAKAEQRAAAETTKLLERQADARRKLAVAQRREKAGVFRNSVEDRVGQSLSQLPQLGSQDSSGALERARSELAQLQDEVVNVDIELNSNNIEIKLRAILARLQQEADRKDVSIGVKTNALKAAAPIASVVKGLSAAKGASADLTALERVNKKFAQSSRDAANSFRAFNAVILLGATVGPALIPVLGGIAGALVAIGPAAVGAAAALGPALFAFKGVGEAFSALGEQSANGAKDAKAAADTMRGAARAVADAEKSLTRARQDAARSAEDSARRVRDARERSAEGIKRAIENEKAAEERLTDAKQDAVKAQADLIAIKKEALEDQKSIADQIAQSELDERKGVVDLFEATVQNNAVQRDGSSTSLDKENSSIALAQAQLSLKRLRQEQAELYAEQAKGDKQGVEGSEDVKAAVDRVKDAQDAVKDAQEDRNDAAAEVDEARADGAQAVADALRDQARAQADSAQAISDAQLNLSRANEDYASSASQVSASTEKVNEAFDKLGPEAQDLVLYLHSLRDEFGLLQRVAAAGFLPEVQSGIALLMDKYFPGLLRFTGVMSAALGDVAELTAGVLAGPAMSSFFAAFAEAAPNMLKVFSQTFLNWMETFALLLEQSLPLSQDFGDALLGISEGAKSWAQDGAAFQSFLEYVAMVAGPVRDFLEAAGRAFFAIVEALTPLGLDVLAGLTAFFEFIANMDPKTLTALATALVGLLVIYQVVQGLNAFVSTFRTFGQLITIGPFALFAIALAGIALVAYVLIQRFGGVNEAIDAVKGAVQDVIDFFNQYRDIIIIAVGITAILTAAFFAGAIQAGVLALGVGAISRGMAILSGIMKVATAIQVAYNTSLFANPIGLIILAIIALVAVLVYFFTQTELGRKIIDRLWEGIKIGFGIIAEVLTVVWTTVIKPIFEAFIAIATFLWEKVLEPILSAFIGDLISVGKYVFGVIKNTILPILIVMGLAFVKLFQIIIEPIFRHFKDGAKLVGKAIGATGDAIQVAWSAAGDLIRAVWRDYIKPVFESFKEWMAEDGFLQNAIRAGVRVIKTIWEGLKEIFKAPIRFVIETVINDGIIGAFNWLSDKVGGPDVADVPLPKALKKDAKATGGVLSGYTPGRDVHRFYSPTGGQLDLSGGEAVMRPEWTSVMGTGYVDEANYIARTKGVAGLRNYIQGGGRQAYAEGGLWHRPGTRKRHETGYPFARWAGDINVPGTGDYGNPVKAYKSGTVASALDIGDTSYGRYIRINHEGGEQTLYAHLSKMKVRAGDAVERGEVIGNVGNYGNSDGPHLHFEIRGGSAPINASSGGGGGNGVGSFLASIGSKAVGFIRKPLEYLQDKLKKPLNAMKEKFGDSDVMQTVAAVPKHAVKSVAAYAKDKLTSLLDFGDEGMTPKQGASFGNLAEAIAQTGSVKRFTPQVQDALRRLKEPMSLTDDVLRRMDQESSGNVRAVNRTDINWQNGTPSVGLMQVIGPTFRAYARGYRDKGPFMYGTSIDPYANIFAGLNYAKRAYANRGGIKYAMNKPGGYAEGGVIDTPELPARGPQYSHVRDNGTMMYDNGGYLPPGLTTVLNLTGKPEPVRTAEQEAALDDRNGRYYGPMMENHFHEVKFKPGDVIDDLNHEVRRQARSARYRTIGRG